MLGGRRGFGGDVLEVVRPGSNLLELLQSHRDMRGVTTVRAYLNFLGFLKP